MEPSSPEQPPRKRRQLQVSAHGRSADEKVYSSQCTQPMSDEDDGRIADDVMLAEANVSDPLSGGSTTEDDDATEEEDEAVAIAAAVHCEQGVDGAEDCFVEQVVTAAQREIAARAAAVDLEAPLTTAAAPAPVAATTEERNSLDEVIDLTADEAEPELLLPPGRLPPVSAKDGLAALRRTFHDVVGLQLTRAMMDDAVGMRAAIAAAQDAQHWQTEQRQQSLAGVQSAIKSEPSHLPAAVAPPPPNPPMPPPNVQRMLQLDPHDAVTDARCARAAFFLTTLEAALDQQPDVFTSFIGILEEYEKGQITMAGVVEQLKRLLLVQADPPRKDLLLRMNMFLSSGNRITQDHVKRVQETALQEKARAGEAAQTVAPLSMEQELVLTELRSGCNVFFTGCGGTGKSHTLKSALALLREQYGDQFDKRVAVTASTGIAASHIGGTTINLAAGVGLPKKHGDFARIFGFQARRDRQQADSDASDRHQFRGVDFRALEVLIVDEVSMLSGEFFDALDAAVTKMRGDAAKKNMEQAQRAQDDPSVQDPFQAFPDSLRDGAPMVALCQARQRLSLAASLHDRLGADSVLALLPRNSLGGGDLHESIATSFAAISGVAGESNSDQAHTDEGQNEASTAPGIRQGTNQQVATEEQSEGVDSDVDSDETLAAELAQEQAAALAKLDSKAAQTRQKERTKRLSRRISAQMERTTRRWLKTEVEGGAEIVGRMHQRSGWWQAAGGRRGQTGFGQLFVAFDQGHEVRFERKLVHECRHPPQPRAHR